MKRLLWVSTLVLLLVFSNTAVFAVEPIGIDPEEPVSVTPSEDMKEEVEAKSVVLNQDGHELLVTYDISVPEGIKLNLQYTDYDVQKHYVVVFGSALNIRSGPSLDYEIVRKAYYGEKLNLVETVRGGAVPNFDGDQWHKVYYFHEGEQQFGYVFGDIVRQREFRLDAMAEKIKSLKVAVDNTKTAFIYNVVDANGRAPMYKGNLSVDNHGIKRYQSAPAYVEPNRSSDFRYMQDGLMVTILDEVGGYYKVNAYDYEGIYYVPKRYVTQRNSINTLNQVVSVDITNQNVAAFDYVDGEWNLISISYATTGADNEFAEPTISGSYQVIQKVDFFRYRDDYTKEISGYAPYGIRFNGGAFIHGVPVNYKLVRKNFLVSDAVYDENGEVVQEAVYESRIVDRIDPGHIEYSASLGTVPLSHKCVRNITSHAKFLWDWLRLGESSVVIID